MVRGGRGRISALSVARDSLTSRYLKRSSFRTWIALRTKPASLSVIAATLSLFLADGDAPLWRVWVGVRWFGNAADQLRASACDDTNGHQRSLWRPISKCPC